MDYYIKACSEINLVKRMDFRFWSPRKEFSSEHTIKTISECVGRDAITASAFYPSIVPMYIAFEDTEFEEYKPFIRVADVRNGLLNYEKTVYLKNDLVEKLSSCIKVAHPRDIVITKGGEYIGEATLVPDYYDEYATCRDVLVIKTKNSLVSGEYLASYLQSKFGKSELIRTKSEQGQPHLTIEKVAELEVPIYDEEFQEEIAKCWSTFYDMIEVSNAHFETAKNIFGQFLDYNTNKKSLVTFTEMISVSNFSQRFDAEYYEKKWSKMVDSLKNKGISFKPIQYVKDTLRITDPQEVFNYITLSDIDDRSGIIKKMNNLAAHALPDRAKRKVIKGDVLVSSLKGSKEKISIVNSESNNIVASTGFYVIRDSDYLPEVIYLIFRSSYYDLFIEQMSSGAIMSSLTEKYFKQFLVPEIPSNIQEEIAEQISQYIITRKSAFENLDKAIRKFDEAH